MISAILPALNNWNKSIIHNLSEKDRKEEHCLMMNAWEQKIGEIVFSGLDSGKTAKPA